MNKNANQDRGHDELIADLEELLRRAHDFDFHDFKNRLFATPKSELVRNLQAIIGNTRKGKYDN
jgi:hypothetical protein